MEYNFTGKFISTLHPMKSPLMIPPSPATTITVPVEQDWNHWMFACSIDDGPLQWFDTTANPTGQWNTGCSISGLSLTSPHTIRIINQPLPEFNLGIGNITLSNVSIAGADGKTFTYVPDARARPVNSTDLQRGLML